MVSYVLSFLSKETKGVHQAAYLLAFFTLMSQFLGLVRDRLLAAIFGAGSALDVYYAAFRIPDLIFVTVSSVVSVSVLVPFLIRMKENGPEEDKKFLDSIFTVFLMVIIFIIVLVCIFMPQLTKIAVPGISDPLLVPLARLLLLSPLILGLSNLLGSITQAKERFLAYALSPILYNFGIVLGVVWFYPIYGLYGLVYGVLVGSFLHLLIQVPGVFRERMLPRITIKISWGLIKDVFALSVPRTLTLASNHLVMLMLIAGASLMTAGSISIFTFAFNLQSVPMGLIGVSYSLAAFPMLSRLWSEGKKHAFVQEILQPLLHVLFWSIPVTVLFVVLRAQMVRTVLGSGAFDWNDTRLTAAACAIFVISMCAQNVTLLLVRAHYAAGHTKKPFYYAIFGAVISFVVAVLFYKFIQDTYLWYFVESLFRVSGIKGTEVLILPIAFSFGSLTQALFLWRSFEKEYQGFSSPLFLPIIQSVGASIVGGYFAYLSLGLLDDFLPIDTTLGIFIQGLGAGIAGIIAMVLILKLLDNQEINVVLRTLHSRIWKAKPVVVDAPEIV